MELMAYDKSLHEDVFFDKVVKKGIRKVFYVYSGRNAWWSTWVKHYRLGCIHATLDDAKQYAEKLRTNGSIFYIEELPALVLEGGIFSLVVTQINCQDVLYGYRPKPKRVAINAPGCYITAGSLLWDAYKSFSCDSAFWEVAPPVEDSVVRMLCKARLRDFELYSASDVRLYKSESIGVNYYLYWRSSIIDAKNKSLARIGATRPTRKRTRLGVLVSKKKKL